MQQLRNMRFTVVMSLAVLWVFLSFDARADLQSDIETVLSGEGLTGIAWSLIGENGEVVIGTAGLRDNPAHSSFTADTRFHVGSLTKTLLATGVLRMATEGLIELDAPASRYLQGLRFDNPWADSSEVTVRHLLDHTSGLNDAQMWQMFSERVKPDTPLADAFPRPQTQLRIRAQPGSRFSYSNMGYTLLGIIIESVVNARYETYLDKHILAPMKMHDSTFVFTTQDGESADPMLAWGHVDDGSRYAASPIFLRPAGQFTTTAADLARFAQFLMSDGVIDDQHFIDETLMWSRGLPSGTQAANGGLIAGYALGMGRRDRHGVVGFCHGGNIVGFVAMLCIFPGEHKAFAYSVNTDSETADYGRIDSLFVRALGITLPSPPPTLSPDPNISEWHGRYVLSPNRFQTFAYLDKVFGAIKIAADGELLKMTSLQNEPRLLRPLGGRIYSANDRVTLSHVLLQGEEGEYLVGDGFKTYEKVSTSYLFAHWISVVLGVSGLGWLFLTGIIALIRHRSGMLRQVQAPAFVALALLPVPIPFFLRQSFMALGDFTLASALLATVTLLLPVGLILTMIFAWRARTKTRVNLLHSIAAVFALQWCVVLIAAGMLPLRLWV